MKSRTTDDDDFPSDRKSLLFICELLPIPSAADYEARCELYAFVRSLPPTGDRPWFASELKRRLDEYVVEYVPHGFVSSNPYAYRTWD